jgi:hypothetical protein
MLHRKFYCNRNLLIVNSKLIQIGGVAKRPKATVCKTVIRRFESGRRLSFLSGFQGIALRKPDPTQN